MAVIPDTDDVVVREQEGDAFLLHVPTGRYFGLNRTGLVIWEALVAGADPVEALAGRWPDVPAAQRQADADTLIGALVDAGLARSADAVPPA
jgi:hypothetical protein